MENNLALLLKVLENSNNNEEHTIKDLEMESLQYGGEGIGSSSYANRSCCSD